MEAITASRSRAVLDEVPASAEAFPEAETDVRGYPPPPPLRRQSLLSTALAGPRHLFGSAYVIASDVAWRRRQAGL